MPPASNPFTPSYETVENPARRLFKWLAVACLWIAGLFVVLAALRGIDQVGLSDRCEQATAEAEQASAELQDARDEAAKAARDGGLDWRAANLAAALVDSSAVDTLRSDAARRCAATDANRARAGRFLGYAGSGLFAAGVFGALWYTRNPYRTRSAPPPPSPGDR